MPGVFERILKDISDPLGLALGGRGVDPVCAGLLNFCDDCFEAPFQVLEINAVAGVGNAG
jgi:hypothetical protein